MKIKQKNAERDQTMEGVARMVKTAIAAFDHPDISNEDLNKLCEDGLSGRGGTTASR